MMQTHRDRSTGAGKSSERHEGGLGKVRVPEADPPGWNSRPAPRRRGARGESSDSSEAQFPRLGSGIVTAALQGGWPRRRACSIVLLACSGRRPGMLLHIPGHRTAPVTKGYAAQRVHSADAEKPWAPSWGV